MKKLIVGLGNPGKEYAKTRHNIGFMILDYYVEKKQLSFQQGKFQAQVAEWKQGNNTIFLVKPQTYMNLSGTVVRKFMDYYKVELHDILIISDDISLPFGKIKLKAKGSSGGHNGLLDIEQHLNTQEYARLKIGIGRDKNIELKDYVLGNLSKEEQKDIEDKMPIYTSILDDFLVLPFEKVMSKYN